MCKKLLVLLSVCILSAVTLASSWAESVNRHILQNTKNDEIERVSVTGNELYLQQEDETAFPCLSELSDSSYDVFAQGDMGDLTEELKKIRNILLDDHHKEHVDKIIDLALHEHTWI